jgi:hypothetical protein
MLVTRAVLLTGLYVVEDHCSGPGPLVFYNWQPNLAASQGVLRAVDPL